MLRALPLMIETAACMSPLQFKSGSLMVAISSTCAAVTLPTFTFCPLAEPALTPARSFSRNEAGGVFSSSVKLLSCARERQRGVSDTHVTTRTSKTVIATGMICPTLSAVLALYSLQKAIMFTP